MLTDSLGLAYLSVKTSARAALARRAKEGSGEGGGSVSCLDPSPEERAGSPLLRELGQTTTEIAIACALCIAICAAFVVFKDGLATAVYNGALAISAMFSGLHGGTMNTSNLK